MRRSNSLSTPNRRTPTWRLKYPEEYKKALGLVADFVIQNPVVGTEPIRQGADYEEARLDLVEQVRAVQTKEWREYSYKTQGESIQSSADQFVGKHLHRKRSQENQAPCRKRTADSGQRYLYQSPKKVGICWCWCAIDITPGRLFLTISFLI